MTRKRGVNECDNIHMQIYMEARSCDNLVRV